MLQQLALRLITTRLFLNFISCIMGFFIWYVISESRITTSTFPITIYFDNTNPEQHIQAPEKTDITISGTRSVLRKGRSSGAVHFDAHRLRPGTQLIFLNQENLLLPSAAKVINYNPIEITLHP